MQSKVLRVPWSSPCDRFQSACLSVPAPDLTFQCGVASRPGAGMQRVRHFAESQIARVCDRCQMQLATCSQATHAKAAEARVPDPPRRARGEYLEQRN